ASDQSFGANFISFQSRVFSDSPFIGVWADIDGHNRNSLPISCVLLGLTTDTLVDVVLLVDERFINDSQLFSKLANTRLDDKSLNLCSMRLAVQESRNSKDKEHNLLRIRHHARIRDQFGNSGFQTINYAAF